MINSYQKGTKELDKIKKSGRRPTLLLHACCAPCSTFPLHLLNDYFDVTIYFNNSNIYPFNEYDRRYKELVKYVDVFNAENNSNIQILKTEYDESYQDFLSIRKKDKEKGPRCHLCYVTRLKQAYQYAFDHHFEYFTTVMTISRQKEEQVINNMGIILNNKFFPTTKFLIHNFKKKGGQEYKEAAIEKYNLYNQLYCGCKFSMKEE